MHTDVKNLVYSKFNPLELSLLQRILLITDGKVTDIIQTYSGENIRVVKLFQEVTLLSQPIPVLEIPSKQQVLKRRILLQGEVSQTNFLYADSIIVLDRLNKEIRDSLVQSNKPIGKLILDYQLETFREVLNCGIEQAGTLAEYFQTDAVSDVIFRAYRVFIGHFPTMLITEKFPASYFVD